MLSILETAISYVPAQLAGRWLQDPSSFDRPHHRQLEAAVLFADLSGFTALAERQARAGAAGTEALGRLLNVAFGHLIETVCAHGGDIVKFAGDALVAIWVPDAAHPELDLAALRAAQAGLALQEGLASKEGLSLRVGIGAGEVEVYQVGGLHGEWETFLAGEALRRTGRAEAAAQPGQVVLTPIAWELVRAQGVGSPLPEGGVLLESLHGPYVPQALAVPALPAEAEKALLGRLPRAVRSRLVAGQTDWLAELRQITVVFANIPELGQAPTLERAQLLTRTLQATIERFEGTINKLSLDEKGVSLLAAFGLPPRSHEDDPARAVHAAMAMRARLEEMGVRVSIGVASGRVFCGEIGNDRRREYTVIGDTVNLAARLMQQAESQVLCDAATFEATQDRFRFEVLAPVQAKGKTGFLSVFRPQGELRATITAGAELVGRTEEKAQLRAAVRELLEFDAGRVVVIEGEAGLGKSRLLDYLLEEARTLGVRCLVGSADAIERSTPYHAWRPIFQQLLLPEGEGDPDRLLQALVASLTDEPDLLRLAPLLNALLPLDLPDNVVTEQMVGQVRADNTNDLLLRMLRGAAPLVIAMEDLHWLDTASWTFLRAVCQAGLPIVVVTTTRPLNDPQLGEFRSILDAPAVERMTLGALPVDEALELVCRQLGVRSLPEPVADLIRTKAEGHPFFSEELALALRDAGFLEVVDGECLLTARAADLERLDLPNTVEGLITSRVDRLAPSQQLSLKVASVIGRVFAYSTLRDIYPIHADRPQLVDYLRSMEELDLTLQAVQEPDSIYVFKHIITQEVVYNLLLFAQRAQLHRAVAEWFETTYQTNLAPYYPLLAHHWDQAGETDQAIAYLEKSGVQALRTGAYQEALRFFEKALSFEVGDRRRRGSWEHCLAEAYMGLGHLADCAAHVRKAMALQDVPVPSGKLGLIAEVLALLVEEVRHYRMREASLPGAAERERLIERARLYRTLGMVHYYANDTLGSIHAILKAKSLASKAGPSAELAVATGGLAVAAGLVPNHALAASYVEKALQGLDGVEDLNLRAQTLIRVSLCEIAVGNWERARSVSAEALGICERLGDRRQFDESIVQLALAHRYPGDFRGAAGLYQRLYDMASSYGNDHHRSWALDGTAIMRLREGAFDEADRLLSEASTLTAGNPDPMERTNHLSQEALLHLRRGEVASAWRVAKTAAELSSQSPPTAVYAIDGLSTSLEVFLALWEEHLTELSVSDREMERWVRRSLGILKKFATLFPIAQPRAWLLQGRYEWLKGKRARAARAWTRALAEAERLGMRWEQGLVLVARGRHGLGAPGELDRGIELLEQVGALDDVRP
ncbi:MAG TPA: adenylate/guanylate cyclase domain-containing protein [Stenomitos sp.]